MGTGTGRMVLGNAFGGGRMIEGCVAFRCLWRRALVSRPGLASLSMVITMWASVACCRPVSAAAQARATSFSGPDGPLAASLPVGWRRNKVCGSPGRSMASSDTRRVGRRQRSGLAGRRLSVAAHKGVPSLDFSRLAGGRAAGPPAETNLQT